ncbi:MAG: sigma-70 family RNA polymerase sigma factor [Elusimicrobia bacterium]|nr:sigma-70 family RNA polymerase sigma factor [Elusimicrobiota bacterium]
MDASERELIERSKAGDAEAFAALVRAHEGKIFNLARNVCAGLPSEAEDVYQETFLAAFENIRSFRGGSSLSTWLYRIAANLCWVRFRKKKREPFVPLLDRPADDGEGRPEFKDWGLTPEEAARKAELGESVTRALSELPVEYRLVLTLRDVEELSSEETAKVLGISVAAVKSRLHRGRLYLRDRFEAMLGEGGK